MKTKFTIAFLICSAFISLFSQTKHDGYNFMYKDIRNCTINGVFYEKLLIVSNIVEADNGYTDLNTTQMDNFKKVLTTDGYLGECPGYNFYWSNVLNGIPTTRDDAIQSRENFISKKQDEDFKVIKYD